MSASVSVILDPDNDVATVRAVHRLAADEPTVLAVAIAPDARTPAGVVWAILRALGKRIDKLATATPTWPDATCWLIAHAIQELASWAHNLTPASTRSLLDLAHRADLQLTLVRKKRHRPRRHRTPRHDDAPEASRPPTRAPQSAHATDSLAASPAVRSAAFAL